MDDASLVGGFKSLCNLTGGVQGDVEFQRSLERFAFHHLHGEEVRGRSVRQLSSLEAVDVGDVGMIEGREDLRLSPETRQSLGIGRHGRGQDLDRDIAIEGGVAGAIDLAHSTRAYGAGDLERPEAPAGCQCHESHQCIGFWIGSACRFTWALKSLPG